VAEILTKSGFAGRLGVNPAAISNLIRRQRLTSPALRADGKIDVEQALRQLGRTVDPVMSASRGGPAITGDGGVAAGSSGPAAQLLKARALSASVDAMRKRQQFMADSGRYMLTADATAEWGRVLSVFLDVERSFADLALKLQSAPEDAPARAAADRASAVPPRAVPHCEPQWAPGPGATDRGGFRCSDMREQHCVGAVAKPLPDRLHTFVWMRH
jgi:hypothetical protein